MGTVTDGDLRIIDGDFRIIDGDFRIIGSGDLGSPRSVRTGKSMGRKRRTALGSAEDAEGRGVHLFCPRRTRGGRGELLFSTGIFGFADFRMRGQLREGGAQGAHVLIRGGRGGARRTATSFLSAEDAAGRGERQLPFCPRRARRGTENGNFLFVRGGRGGARRTAIWSAEDAENVQLLLTAADWDLWILGWGQLRNRAGCRCFCRCHGVGRRRIMSRQAAKRAARRTMPAPMTRHAVQFLRDSMSFLRFPMSSLVAKDSDLP